ncbi:MULTISPECIES: DUF3014 domain-containing protein [Variovorax]|uniref:DUF3014 domain-containing protein n=2 Tax=Variovorax paradoxus TaxID=34073 RepID=A0AAW8E9L8_VARPD|nr:DUF3014 domain-containing protein [Variovorax paradoxus]MBW8715333.1 DUF3014 domain-containing protein [Variovorax paradoxus]MDP9969431.1 hypothetical protein [Variovorax paradoxus]
MSDRDIPEIPDVRDPHDAPAYRPRRETSTGTIVVIVLLAIAAGFLGWRWYQQQQQPPLPVEPPVAAAPNDGLAPAPPPPSLPESPEPQNPIDAIALPASGLPKLADSDTRVMKALVDLMGSKNVADFLQFEGIVRRFVATVDNLAREQSPASTWPVQPTKQRFTTQGKGEAQTIAPGNAARYTPIVQLAESINPAKAAKTYAQLYPLFQKAYEDLGYPGRYFNDRLIAVIDHLLQAPEPAGPVPVRLVEVKGNVSSQRPWVRYEYADPQLESLSSGQKIMVRMGLENERRMKASLRGFREQIATGEMLKKKQQQR